MHIICYVTVTWRTSMGAMRVVGCRLLAFALIAIVAVETTLTRIPTDPSSVLAGGSITLHCSTTELVKGVVWDCFGKCSRRANKTDDQNVIIYNRGRVKDPFISHLTIYSTSPGQFDLRISSADELDDGRYACRDKNGVGLDVAFARLTVNIPSTPVGLPVGLTTATAASVALQKSTDKSGTHTVDATDGDPAVGQSSVTALIVGLSVAAAAAAILIIAGTFAIILRCSPTARKNILPRLPCCPCAAAAADRSQPSEHAGISPATSSLPTAPTSPADTGADPPTTSPLLGSNSSGATFSSANKYHDVIPT